MSNLPEEFKSWLSNTFKDSDDVYNDCYELIEQLGVIGYSKEVLVADRLKYITVIYVAELPHDGGAQYDIIFEDTHNPGEYYSLCSYMNSWFDHEQWDMLCDVRRWSRVNKVSKTIETFEKV